MTSTSDSARERVILFRFCGGARDGELIRSDEPDKAKEAQTLWSLTFHGTVGRRFDVAATSGPKYQRYQVRSKRELDDEIHITCEHVG
jgi:hypothetical protein